MNLYVRYYDGEDIVSSVDELINKLKDFGVPDTLFDDDYIDELYEYTNSKVSYPKRFRISSKQYFILIKTNVSTLEEFKANANSRETNLEALKVDRQTLLTENNRGWYEGEIVFKRVVYSQELDKFQYKDAVFKARLKADSGLNCYTRIVNYLQNREDIDLRSQFPSAKGRNFTFSYLGETLTND